MLLAIAVLVALCRATGLVVDDVYFYAQPNGLPAVGHVGAVGHFFGHTTDGVYPSEVAVYRWSSSTAACLFLGSKLYEKSAAVAAIADGKIANIVPLDYNNDGILDLLVQSTSGGPLPIKLEVFLGSPSRTFRPSGWRIPDAGVQPMMLDYFGRMRVDMLGPDPNGSVAVWRNSGNGFDLLPAGNFFCAGWTSTVFADFDGDGRADMLLICGVRAELWAAAGGASSGQYSLLSAFSLPVGHGPVSAADIDGDGTLDLVFTVCSPPESCAAESSIHIMYNKHPRPYCRRLIPEGNCKPREELFGTKERVSFDSHRVTIQTSALFPESSRGHFLHEDTHTHGPISLHIGDFDLDGYPDVLAIVGSEPRGLHTARVVLLHNVSDGGESRTLRLLQTKTEVLSTIPSPIHAAFVGFARNGLPDIIVNYYQDSNPSRPAHKVIRNAFLGDAFFIRAEALAAAEGAVLPGVTLKVAFTDFDSSHRVRQGSQLSQTAHFALQTPITTLGLGRTNNFIDLFGAAYPLHHLPAFPEDASGNRPYHAFAGIIPNSDIIISPPSSASSSPAAWNIQLILNPSEYVAWVAVSIGLAMLVLAVLAGLFKYREYREDEAEKRRQLHAINFDAL